MPYALCPMPYALGPMPYAVCRMPYAVCLMPYALLPMSAENCQELRTGYLCRLLTQAHLIFRQVKPCKSRLDRILQYCTLLQFSRKFSSGHLQ